ncbi:MAG: cytochrome c family protein [Bacteroidetes bacterium]|nr:cytochrome c family protein [Bacteroidota bacterium]
MTKKNLLMMIVMIFFMAGTLVAQNKYVGVAKCKMCHNSDKSGQQFKKWSETGHANAIKTLSSPKSMEYAKKNKIANPAKEPKCLKCHSTAASVDKSLVESITVEEGVSCETCHGPGSAYKAPAVMKDHAKAMQSGLTMVTQKICEKCHNSKENPFFKPFDYKASLAKVSHPKPKG